LLEPILYSYHEITPLLLAERDTATFAICGVADHDDLILGTDLYALTAVAVLCRTPDRVISRIIIHYRLIEMNQEKDSMISAIFLLFSKAFSR
jgi:hypothetical protein